MAVYLAIYTLISQWGEIFQNLPCLPEHEQKHDLSQDTY